MKKQEKGTNYVCKVCFASVGWDGKGMSPEYIKHFLEDHKGHKIIKSLR